MILCRAKYPRLGSYPSAAEKIGAGLLVVRAFFLVVLFLRRLLCGRGAVLRECERRAADHQGQTQHETHDLFHSISPYGLGTDP